MFDFFKKSSPHLISDKVWTSRPMKLRGMCTLGMESIRTGSKVIIICWFRDNLETLTAFMLENKVPHARLSPGIEMIDTFNIASASVFKDFPDLAKKLSLGKWLILFDSHYPLISRESEVLEKLRKPDNTSHPIIFCSSLDSPLFNKLGGETLKPLLEKLGLKEDESLEHAMISMALKRAREKLEKSVGHEMLAETEGEWFAKNSGVVT